MISKILIIIQRSNGDVFLSTPLINALYKQYNNPQIDLLINDDTLAIAQTLENIQNIHLFSYKKKKLAPLKQEKEIIKNIYKKYDISINLTTSDRSVIYAIFASKFSISAIESDNKKSWWKKIFLTKSYVFDTTKHIILNNISSLNILNIKLNSIISSSSIKEKAKLSIKAKLNKLKIEKFIIFHPSAQYKYKIYPTNLRNMLLKFLNTLDIPIIITGTKNKLDLQIKSELPKEKNIYDFIGETTLDELLYLSDLSSAYIGMDTLNMHIAASQNKKIFAIFGPTILATWSPWSNTLQKNAHNNKDKQTYGNVTIFQANMPCVACGFSGCDNNHGLSECLDKIPPQTIFNEVQTWLTK